MKAGDIVKVKVLEVDLQRKRIALTMRLDEQPGETNARRGGGNQRPQNNRRQPNRADVKRSRPVTAR
ncbi:S1 RNA-binding domain-containing protein [Escherichia coli]